VDTTLRIMVDMDGKPSPVEDQNDETITEIESETPSEGWHHADFAGYYISQWQFAITPLLPGTRKAYRSEWQKHPITDATEAQRIWTKYPDDGIGVVLGPSRLVSVDIKSVERARAALKAFDIDLDALSDRVDIPKIERAPGRYQLIFRAPCGAALRSQTLTMPRESGREAMVVELRAGLLRDVLPPSIRPDSSSSYRWVRAPWETGGIPELPTEVLSLWLRLKDVADELRKAAIIKKKNTTKAVVNGTTKSPSRPSIKPLPLSLRPDRGGKHVEAQHVARYYMDPQLAQLQPQLAMTLGKLLGNLEQVTGSGRQWSARCPAHADNQPSLSVGIAADNSKLLLHCHRGCEIAAVVATTGVQISDLFGADASSNDGPCHQLSASDNGKAASTATTCRTISAPSQPDQISTVPIDWSQRALQYQNALDKEKLGQLAASLGLPKTVLSMIGVG
jgi:hypothetical protein